MRLTRVTNVGEARPATRGAHLRVLDGPDAGVEIAMPAIGLVVGADPGADVVLADDSVSGRHCSIAPSERGFEVRDLESRNGTYLDGVAISRASVPAGAVLRLGNSLVQLNPAEESVALPPSDADTFGEMVGSSLAMRQVFGLLERASKSDAPVLLLGESGTGKELAARAIHDASPRNSAAFVVFDCGAASESLIESALFGHVRGAFTGASTDRQGAFAAAHGGTLFLDEIGDLPLGLQPKLLRLLEAGEVTPLGTHTGQRYDVRVVAATHRDLEGEVGRGGFRGDLYYRLAVVEAHLPPLRKRADDLPALIDRFLAAAGVAPGNRAVEGDKLEKLRGYHWPGNIRELRNVVTRAVALSAPGTAFADMPVLLRQRPAANEPESFTADRPFREAKEELVARFEREYLSDLLRRHGSNLSEAARVAGLERKYLYKLLEKSGLR